MLDRLSGGLLLLALRLLLLPTQPPSLLKRLWMWADRLKDDCSTKAPPVELGVTGAQPP